MEVKQALYFHVNGMGAIGEEKPGPGRFWINEIQTRKFFLLASPSPTTHLKKRSGGGEETGVLSNFSLFHNQKLYLSANEQQDRPESLPTSLSSFHPLVRVLMRRKVFTKENRKKSPCSKWPAT